MCEHKSKDIKSREVLEHKDPSERGAVCFNFRTFKQHHLFRIRQIISANKSSTASKIIGSRAIEL